MLQGAARRALGTVLRAAGSSSNAALCSSVRRRSSSSLRPYVTTTASSACSPETPSIRWESLVSTTEVPESKGGEVDLSVVAAVFRGIDVNLVVRRVPGVLHPERLEAITAHMQGLREALPGVDVSTLVMDVPQVLEMRMEEDLLPRIHTLKTLLPGGDFVHALSTNPEVLMNTPSRLRCSSMEA